MKERSILIPARPVKSANEGYLAFAHRVDEWELKTKPMMDAIARQVDSMLAKPRLPYQAMVTEQVKRDRVTLHERAETNPLLRNMLRKQQR